MAEYLVLIVEPEWDFAAATDEDWAREAAAHRAFAEAVRDAGGTILTGNALAGNDHAVRIRPAKSGAPAHGYVSDGSESATPEAPVSGAVTATATATVTEGPFTESTEVVSGYYVLAIDSDAEARRLAALCPTAGYVELHPIVDLSAVL